MSKLIKKIEDNNDNIISKIDEKYLEYSSKLQLVETKLKDLKEQFALLEAKRYGLQGAKAALSHFISDKLKEQ